MMEILGELQDTLGNITAVLAEFNSAKEVFKKHMEKELKLRYLLPRKKLGIEELFDVLLKAYDDVKFQKE